MAPAQLDPAQRIDAARSDVAEALELLTGARTSLAAAVRLARDAHHWTWADVGHALGISRQAAQERFSRPDRP